MSMKTILAGATLAFALTTGANAAVTQILTPDAGYVSSTTLLAIPSPEFTSFSSLSGSGYTLSFSSALDSRQVGSSWGTWGSPPDTESSSPAIGYSNGATSLTVTFDRTYSIFGFEAEPNPFELHDFTAEFFLGAVSQGSFTRSIDGNAGARLLAASGAFDSVVLTSDTDFALGQFRVAAAAVPEPATWGLMIVGFAMTGAAVRRRRAYLTA